MYIYTLYVCVTVTCHLCILYKLQCDKIDVYLMTSTNDYNYNYQRSDITPNIFHCIVKILKIPQET